MNGRGKSGEQDVCKLLDESARVINGTPPSAKEESPTPTPMRGLLFLLISLLGFLGMRLLPSAFAEGWLPAVTLLAALGLVAASLVEVVRKR